MKYLLATLALAASPAFAWPNSGAVRVITVPAGQHLAAMSSDPLVHPMWAACGGPAGKVQRVINADGSKVYTFTCR